MIIVLMVEEVDGKVMVGRKGGRKGNGKQMPDKQK